MEISDFFSDREQAILEALRRAKLVRDHPPVQPVKERKKS